MNNAPKIIKRASISTISRDTVERLQHRYKSARGQEDNAVMETFTYLFVLIERTDDMEARLAKLEEARA